MAHKAPASHSAGLCRWVLPVREFSAFRVKISLVRHVSSALDVFVGVPGRQNRVLCAWSASPCEWSASCRAGAHLPELA